MRVQSPSVQLMLFGSVLALVIVRSHLDSFRDVESEAATNKGTTLAQSKPVPKTDAGDAKQNELIAEGKKRFQATSVTTATGRMVKVRWHRAGFNPLETNS